MEEQEHKDGIVPDEKYGQKNDPRDKQVSSPMPGVTVVDRSGSHSTQEANLIEGSRGYPFKLQTWEQEGHDRKTESSPATDD